MGKFGREVKVSKDIKDFLIGLLGPSGFGKSTLMVQVCEKLYGHDGYIAMDFGHEDGYAAIAGAIVEKCPTWDHFEEVVADIIKNKDTDYPNLKVVVCDTLDSAFDCAEAFAVKRYNREHMNDKNFVKATSINQVNGGFGKGLDATIDIVKQAFGKLRSAGVGVFFTAHCKEKELVDIFTGVTYSQLTASMSARYFGSIKDISHVVGFGYYNREFEHFDTGRVNPKTNQKKGRDEVTKEFRKIKFRDDEYLVDAKSRFKNIQSEINLDADEFIKAIQDAINSASQDEITNPASKATKAKKVVAETKVEEVKDETPPPAAPILDGDDDIPPFDIGDETETVDKAKIIQEIRAAFATADKDVKKKVKEILISETDDGKLSEDLPLNVLNQIYSVVTI